jgi:large subunit ribosomal protein L22
MSQKTQANFASEASLWMVRCAPQRTRLVADMIRGKSLEFANRTLLLEKMKPAKVLLKLLRSAMANAEQKGVADMDRLFVKDLQVNEGPRIKRFMPRAQGRADVRMGRTSHIVLKLAEKAGPAKKAAAPKKTAKTTSKGATK